MVVSSQPIVMWYKSANQKIGIRTECFFSVYFLFYHKIQVTLKKQGDHTKANKSGEEAQKETMGLIDIGLPQSKK